MINVKKNCKNCNLNFCGNSSCIDNNFLLWEESELSKYERKLKIAMEALKYCSGATDGLDCNDCADDALKKIKEIYYE